MLPAAGLRRLPPRASLGSGGYRAVPGRRGVPGVFRGQARRLRAVGESLGGRPAGVRDRAAGVRGPSPSVRDRPPGVRDGLPGFWDSLMLWNRRGLGGRLGSASPRSPSYPSCLLAALPGCWWRGNPQNLGHTLFVIEIWPCDIGHFDLSALLCLRMNCWLPCSPAGAGCEADAGLFGGRDWVVVVVLTEVGVFPPRACVLITNRNGKRPRFLLSFSSRLFPLSSLFFRLFSFVFKDLLDPFFESPPPRF